MPGREESCCLEKKTKKVRERLEIESRISTVFRCRGEGDPGLEVKFCPQERENLVRDSWHDGFSKAEYCMCLPSKKREVGG